jgi:nanoRNase/pAp phosphatase (c-di-AMP/oligoRNAs hydrolase)
MPTETINQAVKQIKAAKSVLVLASSGSNLDSLASALALANFLKALGKQVKVLSPSPVLPKNSFLPEVALVESTQSLTKNLVVDVSLTDTELGALSYEKFTDKLSIFLAPKTGEFKEENISVRSSVYPFDLVVTLGIANLEELGSFYAIHAQMFYEIPVINIDYKPSNENFGQINPVDITSSSVSEVVYDLLAELDVNLIDEKIATMLLAGLIDQTNSFQSQKTSPKVFVKASKLVDLGGRQQDIIGKLYRSKSLGLLHLWGRVLARLKQDEPKQLVYSAVSMQDIERSGATQTDVDEIIFEMMQQLSFAKYFVLLVEGAGQTIVFVATTGSFDFTQGLNGYKPINITPTVAKFTVVKNITDTETEVISNLTKML